ncbi:hypothetical protein CSOJ01_12199 [Colletotrichum sojae]|uniref:Uncharacterized protein n=1 Tax=Colletotrichum sojae TaxID=2175907 RepID=A0A8H6IVM6_9PEZI|nr:hypothetical protein CSOJ01_12199 [Colletotrichum sojae]
MRALVVASQQFRFRSAPVGTLFLGDPPAFAQPFSPSEAQNTRHAKAPSPYFLFLGQASFSDIANAGGCLLLGITPDEKRPR